MTDPVPGPWVDQPTKTVVRSLGFPLAASVHRWNYKTQLDAGDPAPASQSVLDSLLGAAAGVGWTGGTQPNPGGPSGIAGLATIAYDFQSGTDTLSKALRLAIPIITSWPDYTTPILNMAVPADAVGYELEAGPSALVSVIAPEVMVTNYSVDNTTGTNQTALGTWTTYLRVDDTGDVSPTGVLTNWSGDTFNQTGATLGSWGPAASMTVMETLALDLTTHVDPARANSVLLVEHIAFGGITLRSLTRDETGATVGALMSSTFTNWTIQPPRVRFLYPPDLSTAPLAPPRSAPSLRQLQRGGAGGVGGIPRAVGNPTRQASPRRGSGTVL